MKESEGKMTNTAPAGWPPEMSNPQNTAGRVLPMPKEREMWNSCRARCLTAHHSYVERVRGELSQTKIAKKLWEIICDGCDCENSPECPTEDGCQPDELATAIHRLITEALGKGK